MVRRIHLVLDNDEFARLLVLKGNKTWTDFLRGPHLKASVPASKSRETEKKE